MRWIREFFRPALKCERLGHSPRPEVRRIAVAGGGFRRVMTLYDESWSVCSVCGEKQPIPESRIEVDGFQSVSMPSEDFEKLRKDGFIFWPAR